MYNRKSVGPERIGIITGRVLSKVLDISSATARAAPDLLKAQATLSDTMSGEREDLKPYLKSEKRSQLSR